MSEYASGQITYYGRPTRMPRRPQPRRRRPSLRTHLAVIASLSAILAVFIFAGLALQMKAGADPALSRKAAARSAAPRNVGGNATPAQPADPAVPDLPSDSEGSGVVVVPANPTPAPAPTVTPAPTPAPAPLVTGPS